MSFLKVSGLNYTFDNKSMNVLTDINFSIEKAEIISLIGESGAGKSTLAKLLSNHLEKQSGQVEIGTEKICYIPQELTLSDSKTVFENIAQNFKSCDENEIHVRVREQIEVFGLQYKDHKYPSELSTGQKQRVELAKALVNHPEFVVLDEPFGHLDRSLRMSLRNLLFEIFKKSSTTAIFITHNLEDAYSTSDQIILLGLSRLQQMSTPSHLYNRPVNSYVAKFTGTINLIASNVHNFEAGLIHVSNPFGNFKVEGEESLHGKKFVHMAFRPESVKIGQGQQKLKVLSQTYYGEYYVIEGIFENHKILVKSFSEITDKYINFEIIENLCFALSV